MRNAECGVRNDDKTNAECGMRNAELNDMVRSNTRATGFDGGAIHSALRIPHS